MIFGHGRGDRAAAILQAGCWPPGVRYTCMHVWGGKKRKGEGDENKGGNQGGEKVAGSN